MSESSANADGTVLVSKTGGEENEITHRTIVQEETVSSGDPTVLPNLVAVQGFMARDVLLLTQTIADTDTVNTNLIGNVDIFFLFVTSPLVAAQLAPYRWVRFDLIVTVKMIVPGACAGAYLTQCLADGGYDDSAADLDNKALDAYPNCCQDEWGISNAEISNTIEFRLPWCSYTPAYMVGGAATHIMCWRILLWAVSALTSTITVAATGRVQFFARAENVVVSSLTYQGKKVKKTESDRAPVKSEYSATGKKVAAGVAMLGAAFPVIAPLAEPLAAGLAAISEIAGMFGYTRSNAPVSMTPQVRRYFSSVVSTDTQDTSEVVALFPSNATTIDPRYGGGTGDDPMAFAPLFERWTIVSTTTISTATAVGKLLQVPVTPFFSNVVLGVRYFPVAGFIGLPFAQWRGGMEYMIYIPSHSNFQGSLQVLWEPKSVANMAAFPADPTPYLSNVIIDLSGSSRTLLTVDYAQAYPTLISQPHYATSVWDDISCNGKLTFYLQAPLVTTSAAAKTVKVLIFARAAQDMRFGAPRSDIEYWNGAATVKNSMATALVLQGDRNDPVNMTSCSMNTAGSFDVEELCFGEKLRSVRGLMQILCPIGLLDHNKGNLLSKIYPHFWPPLSTTINANPFQSITTFNSTPTGVGAYFTYWGYYKSMFSLVRGSQRVKLYAYAVVDRTDTLDGPRAVSVFHWPVLPFYGGTSANATSGRANTPFAEVQPLSTEIGSEVVIPGYLRYGALPARMSSRLNVTNTLHRFDGMVIPMAQNYAYAEVFVGGGPDVTVSRFRRVPGVVLS